MLYLVGTCVPNRYPNVYQSRDREVLLKKFAS